MRLIAQYVRGGELQWRDCCLERSDRQLTQHISHPDFMWTVDHCSSWTVGVTSPRQRQVSLMQRRRDVTPTVQLEQSVKNVLFAQAVSCEADPELANVYFIRNLNQF